MSKITAQRGTNDILPVLKPKEKEFEIHKWHFVERVWAELAGSYGYSEIRTPMFEAVELFLRSSGETSDIVSKEMYDFYDKGERHIALKPEGTAPVMRAYLEHSLGAQGGTTRLWYFNHSFRYGRPGKGRYRQLHQIGAELIGSSSPFADAEIIELVVRFLEKLGIQGLKVMVNSIGRAATREKFRQVILDHVSGWLADQDTEQRDKAERNPLRLLDTKDEGLRAILQGLPSILDYLEEDSKAHFGAVQGALSEAGVDYAVTDDVVRGLDYYNDTVFEVVSTALGDGLSLCGGGRYDHLVKQIGGPETPSVGFGAGVERVILAMQEQGVEFPRVTLDAFVVAATEDAFGPVRQLVRDLRGAGLTASWDVDAKKVKQQFKAADRSEARFTLVLGSDEIEQGLVTVKTMATGEQTSVGRAEISGWLKGQLSE